jgi:hypothetical protein
MPQPTNRYDLLRQKKNNFKRQSFYVQANGVAPLVTPPAPLLPVFGVPGNVGSPSYETPGVTWPDPTPPSTDSDTLGTEDSNNVGTESLDYIAVS